MLYVFLLICFGLIGFQYLQILKYKKLCEKEKFLLAGVSHDLKSPIAALINMLNFLLQGKFGELNPEQYKIIELTKNSGNYMSNLINDVLSSYKIDCGKLILKKVKFDVISIIHGVCQELGYAAKEKQQSIIFNSSVQECYVYADPIQIRRVISNFLSNALIYGFAESFIVIDLVQNKEYTEFSVMNKGYALSNDEMKNIFNKFSQTKNSCCNKLSSGLGLYNIKKIIKLHKGEIFAKCSPDGIFTFGFKIHSLKDSVTQKSSLKFI